MTGHLLVAYCWPRTTGRLLLADYYWSCTPGRLLVITYFLPPTTGRLLLPPYFWLPAAGSIRLAIYYWPLLALLGDACRLLLAAACYWPHTTGRLLLVLAACLHVSRGGVWLEPPSPGRLCHRSRSPTGRAGPRANGAGFTENEKAGLLPQRPVEYSRPTPSGRRPTDIPLPQCQHGRGEALDFACTSAIRAAMLQQVGDQRTAHARPAEQPEQGR